ncbi:Pcc1-domain-containing protein [Trematosphaeria pertusa]|uniref:Pcc1-domain-containing protein n=1 Tax=Trematosphaeria pertusa TaxID=390896 RepID=A0A6A6IL16_9PLEO|nr:Pcc1-domain-containing protein [Trematosphaeria pertusa]KAF2250897.1 Pcc1-domain-containing protein [Trematosphaeria pertusa]
MAEQNGKKQLDFPCTLTLDIPFPTAHLASTALRTLSVDAELSHLVQRSFSLVAPADSSEQTVLRVNYAATTNRMLRVAVNGFFESVGVVIGAMKDLDVDVIYEPVTEGLEGVQGLEAVKG